MTTGEKAELAIGSGNAEMDINNPHGVLRLTLSRKKDSLYIGYVSFQANIFSEKLGKNWQHWVSLNSSSYNDDFTGTLGENQTDLPRLLLSFEANEVPQEEEKDEEPQRTPQTFSNDEGEDDSRTYTTGGLIPGSVYTKGNLRVSLERKKVNPNKYRGLKSKEETVAVLR